MWMRPARTTALALAVAGVTAIGGQAAMGHPSPARAGLELHEIGNFEHPSYIAHAPGYRRLLFVVEQPGRISVLRSGHRLHRPFVDLEGRVNVSHPERGLLSVAFPPDYKHSRRFYVYYTNQHGDNEVDELKRARKHPARAVPSSRRRVLLIPHPGEPNHNGGQLQFGPDGDLYIATGDGGGMGDSGDNARHLDVLLGKLLRIDPRKRGRRAYTVPASNPFVGRQGARPEIYAYGFRNPWRFSFDRRDGALAIGDVGQARQEEIDYTTIRHAKAANFGWPEYEGDSTYDAARPDPNPHPLSPTFPILTYTHAQGCAVIGGYVVRNRALKALDGRYLYSDNCNGEIRSLRPAVGGASADRSTGLELRSPTSFGVGHRGRIYVASRAGPVYRLKQAP
jgi:glucose/arabinose dehydrogenase